MEDAPDPYDLDVGADASVLIDLVSGRRLANLRELFGTVAVPALVCAEIERVVSKFPVNKGILDAAWLLRVAADDPDDLTLIADLHRTWRSAPPDNAGEAELVALSRRYGWIALLEDGQGREGARPVRGSTRCASPPARSLRPPAGS